MADNARFHNKLHRKNHHSIATPGYPDSGTDPIASSEEPFAGNFVVNATVSAQDLFINRNTTILGNLSVYGDNSYFETTVTATSSLSVINHGTGPAMTVVQYGAQPIARFIDGDGTPGGVTAVFLENNGQVVINGDVPVLDRRVTISGSITASGNTEFQAGSAASIRSLAANSGNAGGPDTAAFGRSAALGVAAIASGISNQAGGSATFVAGFNNIATGDYSVATGNTNITIGTGSNAEGNLNTAIGDYSHTEGVSNVAIGIGSHTEGLSSLALANYSHTEGFRTSAFGIGSHAEGTLTQVVGDYSHVEGTGTTAPGRGSHAEGFYTNAAGPAAHAEGSWTTANNFATHAEGLQTSAAGMYSHAEGVSTYAFGSGAHTEGFGVSALGNYSHAEGITTAAYGRAGKTTGINTISIGNAAEANGVSTFASGSSSFTLGFRTSATGDHSVAVGSTTLANGSGSFAGGLNSFAARTNSFAFGNSAQALGEDAASFNNSNFATGSASFAIGLGNKASGNRSFASGEFTEARGDMSQSRGNTTLATGWAASSEGQLTVADGYASHTEGFMTSAFGANSHAEGIRTAAYGNSSHTEGFATMTTERASAAYAAGIGAFADGPASFAIGQGVSALEEYAFAQGKTTMASGTAAVSMGVNAFTLHDYSYVWTGDETATRGISSTRTNQFMVSAPGGVYIPGNVGIGTDDNTNSLTVKGSMSASGDVTIMGNLSVYGDMTYLDTVVSVTSALSVVNTGTGPALVVVQKGAQPVARFIDADGSDALFIEDNGFVGVNTRFIPERLTVAGSISASQNLSANNAFFYNSVSANYLRAYSTDSNQVTASDIFGFSSESVFTDGSSLAGNGFSTLTLNYIGGVFNSGNGFTTGNTTTSGNVLIGNRFPTSDTNISPLSVIGTSTQSVYQTIQNITAGVSASTDITILNNVGNYIDIGINNTQYNGNLYSSKFNIVSANDAYIYNTYGNLALGTAGPQDVVLFAGGTLSGTSTSTIPGNERLRVTNVNGPHAGNVGINISTPQAQLTVAGTISASNGLSANNAYLFGNVGINITNPREKLTVAGSISASNGLSANNGYYAGNIGIKITNPAVELTINGDLSANNTSVRILSSRFINLVHTPANDGADPHFYIGEYDNTVTVGTGFSGFDLFYNETGNTLQLNSVFANPAGQAVTIGVLSANRFGTTFINAISVNNGLSANNAYLFGNVGINITNPREKLTVAGGISASNGLSANNGYYGNNVGIKVNNPAVELTVQGSISASNGLSANNAYIANRQTYAPITGPKIDFYGQDPTAANPTYGIGVQAAEVRLSTSSDSIAKISFYTGGQAGTERARVGLDGLTVTGSISATGNIITTGYNVGTVPINIQTGTTYTIVLSDIGGTISSTNTGNGLTAVISGTYPVGFQTSVIQLSTARVTVSGFGVTINNADGFFKTTKQYSAATLVYTGVVGGWVLFGDLSA
jgi:hypothetical protein